MELPHDRQRDSWKGTEGKEGKGREGKEAKEREGREGKGGKGGKGRETGDGKGAVRIYVKFCVFSLHYRPERMEFDGFHKGVKSASVTLPYLT